MSTSVPFTLAKHIPQMFGSVFLYKGSYRQGKVRLGLKAYALVGHMFTVRCKGPIISISCLSKSPLKPVSSLSAVSQHM